MENIKLCEYGCGQEAKFQFKNGKWCCNDSYNKCPENKRKNKESNIGKKKPRKIKRDKPELCDYGCGQKAKYYFISSNTWCCENRYNKCPEKKKQVSKYLIGRQCKKGVKIVEDLNVKCNYGCGKIAKFFLPRVKKFCCSDTFHGCKIYKKLYSTLMKKSWRNKSSGHNSENRKEKRRIYMKNGGSDIANTEENRKNTSKRLKDKTWEEVYGKNKAIKMKKRIGKKSKRRMLDGGSVHALSFVKNPSKPQVELYNRVKELYPSAILNYPCYPLNYSLDVAIPELKIWFESDGSWYHQDKEKDLERQKKIEELGWKLIRYYPVDNVKQVPSKEKIFNDVKRKEIK